jgi:cellobiose phosphorylase
LVIDPCIPQSWDGFKATRQFRGTRYEIEVQNPNHISKGVELMRVDGQRIDGNIVPIFVDGQSHHVQIILGE